MMLFVEQQSLSWVYYLFDLTKKLSLVKGFIVQTNLFLFMAIKFKLNSRTRLSQTLQTQKQKAPNSLTGNMRQETKIFLPFFPRHFLLWHQNHCWQDFKGKYQTLQISIVHCKRIILTLYTISPCPFPEKIKLTFWENELPAEPYQKYSYARNYSVWSALLAVIPYFY